MKRSTYLRLSASLDLAVFGLLGLWHAWGDRPYLATLLGVVGLASCLYDLSQAQKVQEEEQRIKASGSSV